MGLSWHTREYSEMEVEVKEMFMDELGLPEEEANWLYAKLMPILIDNGAVDPT